MTSWLNPSPRRGSRSGSAPRPVCFSRRPPPAASPQTESPDSLGGRYLGLPMRTESPDDLGGLKLGLRTDASPSAQSRATASVARVRTRPGNESDRRGLRPPPPRAFRPRPRLGAVVCPGSCVRPAGVSPVPVGTGAPGSRLRFVIERLRAERSVESPFGGSNRAGRSVSERCSLVRVTTGEPSRSCHGEGHVLQALFRGQPVRSPRGRDGGTYGGSGTEQERPVCARLVGQETGRISRW